MTFSILSPKSMSSLDLLHKDHLSGLKPEGVGKTRSVEETNKHENKKKIKTISPRKSLTCYFHYSNTFQINGCLFCEKKNYKKRSTKYL